MKEEIISWLRQQIKETKAEGIVLGLSGGVDSSCVAVLAKEALGRKNLLALLMPCHSQPQDLDDAKILARKFRIKIKIIDLSKIYDDLIKILPGADKLALANLKPRLRMLVLYYAANKLNYLVAGTGNKSEINTGYFTKYGDGAADILPLGGLLKKDVRNLAKELGLPQHIIAKAPSAGLWPGQTDEGEMGVTYPELDDILGRLEKKEKQALSVEKVDKVKKMIERSRHKRQGPKVCYIKTSV